MLIQSNDKVVAIIDNIKNINSGIQFLGEKTANIQVGTFNYSKNKIMRDHYHITNERKLDKTQEILIVFCGSCEVRLYSKYNDTFDKIYTGILYAGDYCIIYDCGVGYTVLEDGTKMMEIKAGSYTFESDDVDRILL